MSDDPVARLHADIHELRTQIHLLGINDERVNGKLATLERDVARLVPIDRYLLVERVVYGTVALILVAFLSAVIALVVR